MQQIYAQVSHIGDDYIQLRFDFLGSGKIWISKKDIKKSVLNKLCHRDLFSINIPDIELKKMLEYIGDND